MSSSQIYTSLRKIRIATGVLVLPVIFLAGCATNPNQAKQIDTKVENSAQVSGDTTVGVKDGNMIVQKKVAMNEELRLLQNEVYELEDHVYGNRKYGSLGLYGVLKDCKLQLSDKANGGTGKLAWTEPLDRVTDKEDEFHIGVDEQNRLVGVSEEMLKDRITRFRGYKTILEKRQDEYQDKVDICKAELKAQKSEMNDKANAPNGVVEASPGGSQ
jgi:hypothetical protein